MIPFLTATFGMFVLCWIWIGGYLADLAIWLISKFTPKSSNETNLAYVFGVAFFLIGIVVAAVTKGQTGPTAGGAIAGAGLYVAVRLPGKVRSNRIHKAAKNGSASAPSTLNPARDDSEAFPTRRESSEERPA